MTTTVPSKEDVFSARVHFWHMIDGGHWDTANGIEDSISQRWYLKGTRKQVEERLWQHIGYGPEVNDLPKRGPFKPYLEIQELEDGFIVYDKGRVDEEYAEYEQKQIERDFGGEAGELYWSCRAVDAMPNYVDYYDLTQRELERLR